MISLESLTTVLQCRGRLYIVTFEPTSILRWPDVTGMLGGPTSCQLAPGAEADRRVTLSISKVVDSLNGRRAITGWDV